MEMVWCNVKSVELANLCPETIGDEEVIAHASLERVGSSYQSCVSLSLTTPALSLRPRSPR
jgi:hypothetical protein